MGKWTTQLTVNFVPLPKEKEEAYWAAIDYFARVMFADLLDAEKEAEPIKIIKERQVKAMTEEIKLCESCGERPGETNSRILFHSPLSDPDCGDWVCFECEQAAEQDHYEESEAA